MSFQFSHMTKNLFYEITGKPIIIIINVFLLAKQLNNKTEVAGKHRISQQGIFNNLIILSIRFQIIY